MNDMKINIACLVVGVVIFHVLSYMTNSMKSDQLFLSIVIWLTVGSVLIVMAEVKNRRQRTKEVS